MNRRPSWASLRSFGARPLLALLALVAGAPWYWARPDVAEWTWMAALVGLGLPIAARTFAGLRRGHFAADVIAALAILSAIALWQPLAGLTVVLMQTGGEALERHAQGRASAALEALIAAAPRVAHRRRGAEWVDVAAEDVRRGDVLRVRPGELVPCDGTILEGNGSLDLSRLTGEPLPLRARTGRTVRSGSAVVDAPVIVEATNSAAESEYARIVSMVRAAQASKAPFQRLADRYATWFTPFTLAAAGIGWWIGGDAERALAVLVVATPCPMILATPVAMMGGIGRAARRGLIFRRGSGIEAAAGVTAAIVDKTGTLTLGRPAVSRIVPRGSLDDAGLLRLAAAVEGGSGHELARSVEAAAALRGLAVPVTTETRESPGRGVSGCVEGSVVAVGGLEYIDQMAPAAAATFRSDPPGRALRAYITLNGAPAGTIEFADRPRAEAGAALARLRSLGVHPLILLSGDTPSATEALGVALGLDEARGDQLPADKLAVVTALQRSGQRVLMVGDGTNDAPALSAADLGIALAAGGGGISAEAADVVVLNDDLHGVADAVAIGRQTMRIARQSLWVGLGLSGVAMLVAAAGAILPAIGALLQEAIDVAVILNALRSGGEDVGTTRSPARPGGAWV